RARPRPRATDLPHRAARLGAHELRRDAGVHTAARATNVTPTHATAIAFLVTGVVIAGSASIAAVALPDTLDRLHAVTPITSLAGPLIGIAIAIDEGPDLTTGLVLLIVAL